ncbi:NlpC/P60 family protein [Dactylosporangium sp. NPDC051485]|uniref:C40 family peptidase n=1 Tax=Dactylosporangium sp. NPDC051485 TaxID=3154846 RepID=UPI0034360CD1
MRLRRGPMVTAAVVCTMLCSLVARPAYADPTGDVPDTGSRPVASGQLLLPGTGATTAPPAATTGTLTGPKAAELAQLELAVAQLGEKRNRASQDLDAAQNSLTDAQAKLAAASQKVTDLKEKADSAAAEAYKRATGLGPLDSYANDLHKFGLLAPGLGSQGGDQQAARDLLFAQQSESAARQEVQAAQFAVQSAQTTYTPIDTDFQARNAQYVQLRAANEALVLQLEAQQDRAEQALAPGLVDSPVIDGKVAHPNAIRALNLALSKVGIAWYVWGDEGPDTFDCSGLAYWAYGQVGVRVPRVAADMYHGTHAIQPSKKSPGDQLLPGDLVYFATDMSDWRTIYHMGIYIGGGKMVNAPTSGQKVKIAEVRWSRLFGATRIFDAVPAPNATHTTPPAGGSTTTPPAGGGSTSPSPSSSASPTPTATGSGTPSPDPSTSSTPSPDPTTPSPDPTTPSTPPTGGSKPPSKEPSDPPPAQTSTSATADHSAPASTSAKAQTSVSASGG